MARTFNRGVEKWSEVFPDTVLANATIDRILDRAGIIQFQGKSYRLKGKISLPSFGDADIMGGNRRGGLKDEPCGHAAPGTM
ncbi:MAG: ATP-binding protein [Candidatus Binatia bacterium]